MKLARLAITALLLAATLAHAGLEDDGQPVLLVADPGMGDENFARTVVAVAFPQDGGAMGVILNRASGLTLGELLGDQVAAVSGRPDPVGMGGPVTPDGMLFLFRADSHPVRALPMVDDWYLSGDGQLFDALARLSPGEARERVRYFVGYTGWAEGQLDREVNRGDWQVLPLDAAVLLDADPESLWSRMMARTRARSAALTAP
ncbi:MAG: YqgE/AlgH family protein [Betaproteobacteria bacterium]|jgi:putative transcriptional regulator|nr:YqgE/AlgH family protein [Rhodocyclaceae bacterium]MCA3135373.1 YqgE/AlgH family protein [Rhodocyclaceae bacterium]MCA3140718.1 YqgE/AlgH family protein [Rhodocyclaceae bacterium]MCA3146251.1 YqgE/AlgH family protein [Rhodocyclaceae bacterium]MCE2897695.1 YqgE/AlgH family protein [Betaproteobacteria bacterium]